MSKKLFKIISEVMNTPISQINENSSAETLQEWDSFKMYVLINEIEKEFNIKFSLKETLEIKNRITNPKIFLFYSMYYSLSYFRSHR